MLRRGISVVLFILLLTSLIGFAFADQPAEAVSGTIYINADGSVTGTAYIQTADNTTYVFTANINNSIMVERNNIVIDGNGYVLQGGGSGTGIETFGTINVTIQNLEVADFNYGVFINSSSYSIISRNDIENSYCGIGLSSSSNYSTLWENNVTNNQEGIDVFSSSSNNISENKVGENNGNGIWLASASNNNTISGNIMTNNYAGINLYSSINNVISDNTATGSINSAGILLSFSNNTDISGNNVANNYYGIRLIDASSYNNLVGNNVTANQWWGISLDSCLNNAITENSATSNSIVGIYLVSSLNNVVSGNGLTEDRIGIGLDSSTNNSISENNVTSNSLYGLYLYSSSNNTVSGNNMTDGFYGIYLSISSNNSLVENRMTNNDANFYLQGSFPSDFLNNIDETNTVNGKPIYYWIHRQDMNVPQDAGYVALINCTHITAQNLNLTNNGQGILLAYSTNSTIIENRVTANTQYGIELHNSSCNMFSENNITANNYAGIFVDLSSNNNDISANNFSTNNYTGIELDGSSNNTIWGNDVISNKNTGIWLDGSSGNLIYHNNFSNNSQQIYSSGSSNSWDNGYPSGGNYWDNYSANDDFTGPAQNITGCDGIGDSPFNIGASNIDHYPLMGPCLTISVADNYYMQVSSNSTTSNLQFNGTALSLDVSGLNGTSGFCRISIPTAMISGTIRVFVNGTEVAHSLSSTPNETYNYLYFSYTHSTEHVIIVIPEFPPFLTLPLFMITTLLAIIVCKRKVEKREAARATQWFD
jgi:parallel beta-helix repeat protein